MNTEKNPKVKVKVENVYKVFGRNPKSAVKLLKKGLSRDEILKKTGNAIGVIDASFEVYEGETVVVMGLSGSGKSTILRCLNRLYEPTGGSIYIDGEDITKFSRNSLRHLRQHKFGMVFQQFALFPHKSVLENAMYGLEIQKEPLSSRKEKAMSVLDQVGLKGWENYYPDQLSGGMQQRVGLARALAINPDILLMDEAFSALDPLIRAEMQDELLALEDEVQKTIIFITHDLDEALKLGDRIVLMKDGRIVQVGTNEEILKAPATEYVEKFVENVDMIKILTAKDAMVHASHITTKDGPRTALHMMKHVGISSIFVTDRRNNLKGIVMAEDAKEAINKGYDTISNHITPYRDYIAHVNTPLQEILPIMVDNRYPVAVLDDNDKFVGMIVRGSVISSLIDKGEANEA